MMISFSGLDGAGKSTLIAWLDQRLKELKYPATCLAMYYDLSFYAMLRKLRDYIKRSFGLKNEEVEIGRGKNRHSAVLTEPVFESKRSAGILRDPKIGTSDKKKVASRIIYGIARSVAAKKVALFLDLFTVTIGRLYVERAKRQILIVDRYLYDSLADVSDLRSREWGFVRFFVRISPVPELPIFVDLSPEEAYARKGEYPIEYMKWRRETYMRIFNWVNSCIIIDNSDLQRAQKDLEAVVLEALKKSRSGIDAVS